MNRNNPDCQWFDNATEASFAAALTPADRTRFEAHASTCAPCAADLAELRAVDPLMKNLLQYRVSLAQSAALRPSGLRWGRVFALASVPALAGALALGIALWPQALPAPPQIVVSPPQPTLRIDKNENPGPTSPNLKPRLTIPALSSAGDRQNKDVLPTEEFALIDAAGSVRTLTDFRGHFFLFGVLSSAQPRTAANLERLYRTFGSELRLVAVSHNRHDPAPPNTTFQTLFNDGSRLLGARESDFVLVDAAGSEILRGSLATPDAEALTKSVRTALGPH